jgi:small-conductance mechanosensitive channel
MTRRKKPDGETQEQASARRQLEAIADKATRSEKVSWERKLDNMVSLIARLRPIEEQIVALMAEKQPIIDDISALRREMVHTCVHPYTHLAQKGELVTCKFCERQFKLLQNG